VPTPGVAEGGRFGLEEGHGGEVQFANGKYVGAVVLPGDIAAEGVRAGGRCGLGLRSGGHESGHAGSLTCARRVQA